jgi:hypothetical protein
MSKQGSGPPFTLMSPTSVPVPFRGTCACGAVTYECIAAPLRMVNCYCADCQRASGGAFSPTIVVPTEALTVVGDVCSFEVTADSGAIARRSFCGRCGTPLFSNSSARPTVTGIKAGSLDDGSWFAPSAEYWCSSKLPWHESASTVEKFERSRP